jgi:LuxR family maltose regulon positive regulatory protein
VIEVPVPANWAAGTGTSYLSLPEVKLSKGESAQGWAMATIETVVEAAGRYIIKRPRLTRLLDNANARVLMLIAPAGFGKTTLAREWIAERRHVWYRGTTATADVAALAAGFAEVIGEVIPEAGMRAINRMRATGTPEDDVAIIGELFAEDLVDWPDDTWLVFDDYQFAMDAKAPELFVDLLLRNSPMRLLLTSRKRPTWASARRLLYGEVYELGRNELAMDHDEAASVLAHRKDTPAAGLVALAEGWPAVIGLAALTEELELPEGGLPDALYEYFAEELYQAASPGVQEGLCKLALAPSLREGSVNFLLGEKTSQVVAEGLRLGFLAIRSEALELHPLLRTFLETKSGDVHGRAREADRLARHLAEVGLWDDAFALVKRFFSSDLFSDLLETALPTMLAEARLASLSGWLELARSEHVDTPIIDLAESEIAFHQGSRRRSEALAVRAARNIGSDHQLLSRAYYLAGMSAHLEYHNDRARTHCDRALANARTVSQQRDAIWGQLLTALDLGSADASELLSCLVALDDGSALSEVRLANAHYQVAIRRGKIKDSIDALHSAEQVIDRITEPLTRSSFLMSQSAALVQLGRYSEALVAVSRCESYARESRVSFAIPFTKRVRAIAELGLRHFARCSHLVDWIEAEALHSGDVFLDVEARLIRSRMLIAQGLPSRAIRVLEAPTSRFPWEGERGEYLATLGLALACLGDSSAALDRSTESSGISDTVEVKTLTACIAAIVASQRQSPDHLDLAATALQVALDVGSVDSFVIAYRGHPRLLDGPAQNRSCREALRDVVDRARDWPLAKQYQLDLGSRKPTPSSLSRREEEVLGLLSQGLKNREIAETLFITESTAKVHVRHIFDKLGVRTRTEAALKASLDAGESS